MNEIDNHLRVILVGAVLASLAIFILFLYLLLYRPGVPSATATPGGQIDASAPEGNDTSMDIGVDASFQIEPSPSDRMPNATDGGPAQRPPSDSSDDDAPRFVLEDSADSESEDLISEQDFTRLIIAARNTLENSAIDRVSANAPAEDRYCWNMDTADAASFALTGEELNTFLTLPDCINFPCTCMAQSAMP